MPKPRTAKQNRAKQTVENILTATAQIIQKEGLEKLTTNKVAEKSGVNIASIYQYFPNKEALINALTANIIAEHQNKLETLISSLHESDIEEAARETIETGIEIYRASEGLIFVLLASFNRPENVPSGEFFQKGLIGVGKTFLLKHQSSLKVKNIDRALYIISNAFLGLVYNYLLNAPDHTNDDEFIEETVSLIKNYLC